MDAPDITEDKAGFLWVTNGTGPGESLWMGIQRFMYLNDLSGEDFLRLGYRLNDMAGPPSTSALHRPLRIYSNEPALPFLADLDNGSMDGVYARPRLFFEEDRPLRYCPECLAYCYHSLFFQHPALERCPYHGTPLLTSCQRCGKPLACLSWIAARHPKPFCCTACGNSYVPTKEVARRVLFGLPDASEALGEAYDLIFRIFMSEVASARGMLKHDFADDRFIRFHCHALHAAATDGAAKPAWLIGLEEPINYRLLTSVELPRNEPASQAPEEDQIPPEEHLRSLLCILKSLNRHFSRQVRSLCKHRRPRALRSATRRSGRDPRYFLRLAPTDCPCCAVLSWWRATFGYYFALRQLALSPDIALQWLEKKRWQAEHLPFQAEALARTAWNTFTGLAMHMAYRFSTKSEQLRTVHRDLSVYSRAYKELTWSRVLEFEQLRARRDVLEIDPPEENGHALLCADPLARTCMVSYSLQTAMRTLAQLHAIRQAGSMWTFPQLDAPPDHEEGKDLWYRKGGLQVYGRTWMSGDRPFW